MTTPSSFSPSGPCHSKLSTAPRSSAATGSLNEVSRFGAASGDVMYHSSEGRCGSLPVKAIAPLAPTARSTQKDQDGFTGPRLRRRAGPSSGWSQSDTRVPSLPPTRIDLPSGIQRERYRQRSRARVRIRGVPPAVGTRLISLTLFWSPSRLYQYAICVPSGLQDGTLSSRLRPVRARIAPVPTSSAWMATLSPSPKCGPICFAKAIVLPSGDQARGDDGGPGGSLTGRLQAPEVRRCAAPPSAG